MAGSANGKARAAEKKIWGWQMSLIILLDIIRLGKQLKLNVESWQGILERGIEEEAGKIVT